MSRTANSVKNIITSILCQLLAVLLQFANRTVFIHMLGEEYLGVSGLFTNIISMLSLAELGVGTAIIYKLYKPIEKNDKHMIYLLMKFYKTVYRWISLVIFVAGLILMPFLKNIIKDDVTNINIYVIFFLYLIQSVSSYMFFAYKSALIQANQKEYITTIVSYIFILLANGLQIISLYILKSFTIYVAISIFTNICMNITISIICNRMYPFINIKCDEKLDKSERKNIFMDCYALMIYKANAVVLNSTDNIILSKFIGLAVVGIYSNYLMIYNLINTILNKIYSAITASLGNLHASNDVEHEYDIFNVVNFISFVIFTIASMGLIFVSNKLITVWIGEKFTFDFYVVLLIGIKMYIDGQKKVLSTYRNTMGLFQQAKYRPLAGVIINIVASLILVKYYGISGVILGTIIADLSTYMWYDPYIIFKHSLHRPVSKYYIKRLEYLILFVLCGLIIYGIVKFINLQGFMGVIVDSAVCVVIPILVISAVSFRKKEFIQTGRMVKNFIKKR